MGRYSRDCTIINKLGIHARPSTLIVKTANEHKVPKDTVFIVSRNNGFKADSTSIMHVMMLAAAQGEVLTVYTENQKFKAAVDGLANVISKMEFD